MRNPRLALQTLAGESLLIMGATARQCPFCISILTSVRRIVKIAVRFFHTKTALCDRKDTQSRFAVNAARGMMCVGTGIHHEGHSQGSSVSMPHAALCVSGQRSSRSVRRKLMRFNAARNIVCVGTLCPAALVPRGLHRFGKTKRRYAALRPCRSTLHFLLLYDSIRFVLFQ